MPREDYQERLEMLQDDVIRMSYSVLDRFDSALTALETRDEDLAWEVIDGDAEVNETYLEIEQECVDLIALQQPVAGDLRLIVASFKIITDLERIGDLATNLAEVSLEADTQHYPGVDAEDIAGIARDMVEDSVQAYVEEDVKLCYEVDRRDDGLDELCEDVSSRVIRELIEAGDVEDDRRAQEMLEEATQLLLTIRDLERVGDHAVNIAARTLYMIESDDELIW